MVTPKAPISVDRDLRARWEKHAARSAQSRTPRRCVPTWKANDRHKGFGPRICQRCSPIHHRPLFPSAPSALRVAFSRYLAYSWSHSERSGGGYAGGAQSKNPGARPEMIAGGAAGFAPCLPQAVSLRSAFDCVPSRLRPPGTPLRMTPGRDFQTLLKRRSGLTDYFA